MSAALEICIRGAGPLAGAVLLLAASPAQAQSVGRVDCANLTPSALIEAVRSFVSGLNDAGESAIRADFGTIRADLAEAVRTNRGVVPGTGRTLFTLPDGREVRLQCAAGTTVLMPGN